VLRKARIEDIKQLHNIINQSASRGEMLPRSLGELYDNIRDYFVYDENGLIAGLCAVHICWEDLSEIRSLYVVDEFRLNGIGRKLVNACIDEAKGFNIGKVFLLTYRVDFFKKCGFNITDKKELPQKIWSDCMKCPRFPVCDEIAMIMNIKV